ncbi:hypothetical protein [Streptomyces sp. NEAU-NA10]|uniref:hypothetical protein n=1 Tax=Streptomyces sp. NEAU-NA10 TaxID=3416050 RepID=UPI003CC5F377
MKHKGHHDGDLERVVPGWRRRAWGQIAAFRGVCQHVFHGLMQGVDGVRGRPVLLF